ncbi:hypothetical protein FOA52_010183 [Chlamydomonas sp. UWO 241]|nr:hypothetical protein FOA52_010183 [Chlamydomonas sp. UWO 241]
MASPKSAPKTCLYDVLCVARDVEEDGIKKAYRKQALIWHPDKNAHRPEEAAEKFKELQNAYEILSDKHERAWYDSHRDQILKSGERHQAGGGSYEPGQQPHDEDDLFPFFSNSCFSGYGDGPKGFYGVYASLFEKLARAEMDAFASRNDDDKVKDCPTFPR